MIETANEITLKAEKALHDNGGQVDVFSNENVVLISFPEGTEQIEEDEFRLPNGQIIAVDEEDLGAFWERAGPSKFYLKGRSSSKDNLG